MPPKTRTNAGTMTQQSLKASFNAVRSAKGGVPALNKKKIINTDAPAKSTAVTAPKASPKKVVSKRRPASDEESSAESDIETSFSDTDDEEPKHVEVITIDEYSDDDVKVVAKPSAGAKSGISQTIHTEGETKFQKILRVFDLSYEYGPCVGVTRLERWERAQAMGLNPPKEVHDILLTQEGQNELANNVFDRRV
ncbi:hypothetical protein CPB86DRAFT_824121 [Serendipita vermifera]|nr:hypothetical protein CPB86DRAFT_824121 [Serendipita vermifera]